MLDDIFKGQTLKQQFPQQVLSNCSANPACDSYIYRNFSANAKAITILLLVLFTSVACSGGSGNSNSSSDVTDLPENITADSRITSYPADPNEPNTIGQDLVTDSTGTYHAAYADIDGRAFYAQCQTACSIQANWTSVVIEQFELESITGSVTPKILLGEGNDLHIAFAINTGGFGIFSEQSVHYAVCSSTCTSNNNWNSGQAVSLNRSQLRQEVQNTNWFALSPAGQPRFSFIEPSGSFGDEFLYFFSCDAQCTSADNWNRVEAATLNLASSTTVNILIDNLDIVHLIAEYQIIGSDTSQLVYLQCVNQCSSDNPIFSEPLNITQLITDVLVSDEVAVTLSDSNLPIVAVLRGGDTQRIELFNCDINCTGGASWSMQDVTDSLPLPASVTELSSSIAIANEQGVLNLAIIGKDRSSGFQNRLMQFSCVGVCKNGQWSYRLLAETSSITYPDQGICLFIGTSATGPIKLVRGGFSFGLYPYWGCSTDPVLVTDGDGNVYIDTNADIRFFEVAAFGLSN